MTLQKGLTRSVTFWGAVVALLPSLDTILAQLGVVSSPILAPIAAEITSIAGSVLAIWGRIRATKKIVGL